MRLAVGGGKRHPPTANKMAARRNARRARATKEQPGGGHKTKQKMPARRNARRARAAKEQPGGGHSVKWMTPQLDVVQRPAPAPAPAPRRVYERPQYGERTTRGHRDTSVVLSEPSLDEIRAPIMDSMLGVHDILADMDWKIKIYWFRAGVPSFIANYWRARRDAGRPALAVPPSGHVPGPPGSVFHPPGAGLSVSGQFLLRQPCCPRLMSLARWQHRRTTRVQALWRGHKLRMSIQARLDLEKLHVRYKKAQFVHRELRTLAFINIHPCKKWQARHAIKAEQERKKRREAKKARLAQRQMRTAQGVEGGGSSLVYMADEDSEIGHSRSRSRPDDDDDDDDDDASELSTSSEEGEENGNAENGHRGNARTRAKREAARLANELAMNVGGFGRGVCPVCAAIELQCRFRRQRMRLLVAGETQFTWARAQDVDDGIGPSGLGRRARRNQNKNLNGEDVVLRSPFSRERLALKARLAQVAAVAREEYLKRFRGNKETFSYAIAGELQKELAVRKATAAALEHTWRRQELAAGFAELNRQRAERSSTELAAAGGGTAAARRRSLMRKPKSKAKMPAAAVVMAKTPAETETMPAVKEDDPPDVAPEAAEKGTEANDGHSDVGNENKNGNKGGNGDGDSGDNEINTGGDGDDGGGDTADIVPPAATVSAEPSLEDIRTEHVRQVILQMREEALSEEEASQASIDKKAAAAAAKAVAKAEADAKAGIAPQEVDEETARAMAKHKAEAEFAKALEAAITKAVAAIPPEGDPEPLVKAYPKDVRKAKIQQCGGKDVWKKMNFAKRLNALSGKTPEERQAERVKAVKKKVKKRMGATRKKKRDAGDESPRTKKKRLAREERIRKNEDAKVRSFVRRQTLERRMPEHAVQYGAAALAQSVVRMHRVRCLTLKMRKARALRLQRLQRLRWAQRDASWEKGWAFLLSEYHRFRREGAEAMQRCFRAMVSRGILARARRDNAHPRITAWWRGTWARRVTVPNRVREVRVKELRRKVLNRMRHGVVVWALEKWHANVVNLKLQRQALHLARQIADEKWVVHCAVRVQRAWRGFYYDLDPTVAHGARNGIAVQMAPGAALLVVGDRSAGEKMETEHVSTTGTTTPPLAPPGAAHYGHLMSSTRSRRMRRIASLRARLHPRLRELVTRLEEDGDADGFAIDLLGDVELWDNPPPALVWASVHELGGVVLQDDDGPDDIDSGRTAVLETLALGDMRAWVESRLRRWLLWRPQPLWCAGGACRCMAQAAEAVHRAGFCRGMVGLPFCIWFPFLHVCQEYYDAVELMRRRTREVVQALQEKRMMETLSRLLLADTADRGAHAGTTTHPRWAEWGGPERNRAKMSGGAVVADGAQHNYLRWFVHGKDTCVKCGALLSWEEGKGSSGRCRVCGARRFEAPTEASSRGVHPRCLRKLGTATNVSDRSVAEYHGPVTHPVAHDRRGGGAARRPATAAANLLLGRRRRKNRTDVLLPPLGESAAAANARSVSMRRLQRQERTAKAGRRLAAVVARNERGRLGTRRGEAARPGLMGIGDLEEGVEELVRHAAFAVHAPTGHWRRLTPKWEVWQEATQTLAVPALEVLQAHGIVTLGSLWLSRLAGQLPNLGLNVRLLRKLDRLLIFLADHMYLELLTPAQIREHARAHGGGSMGLGPEHDFPGGGFDGVGEGPEEEGAGRPWTSPAAFTMTVTPAEFL